jgi:uncharacterized protein (DUF302 family)
MNDVADIDGLLTLASQRSVAEVMDRLEVLLPAHRILVFARINFSADAAAVGLSLHPTELLIVGNPTVGTPLMVASPSTAIDLPLKVLAWSGVGVGTRVSYNDPAYLQRRHGFSPGLVANIAGLGTLVARAASQEA